MTIHRKTSSADAGEVPDRLLRLVETHHPKAVTWKCLPRAGRHGYKHANLEIYVNLEGTAQENPHTTDDVAGHLLAMMQEHQELKGDEAPEGYRIDAFDDNDDRLNGEGDFLRFRDGEAVDLVDSRDKGTWALKALDAEHKRRLDLMDRTDGISQIAIDAMNVLASVIGDVIDVKIQHAERTEDSEDKQRKHDRQMKLLEFIMAQGGASSGGEYPLRDLLKRMPAKVKATFRDIIGDERWAVMNEAASNPDRGVRATQLQSLMSQLQAPSIMSRINAELPAEWKAELRQTIAAEVMAGS